jgi:hypothetical protein
VRFIDLELVLRASNRFFSLLRGQSIVRRDRIIPRGSGVWRTNGNLNKNTQDWRGVNERVEGKLENAGRGRKWIK